MSGRLGQRVLREVRHYINEAKISEREWWNRYSPYIRKTMDTLRAAAGHELKTQWQGENKNTKNTHTHTQAKH